MIQRRLEPKICRRLSITVAGLLGVAGFCGARASADVPRGAITALAFSPDGKRLAVGGYGEAVLYDTSAWQPGAAFSDVEDSVTALAFHPDGLLLAVGSGHPARSGDVKLWDTSGKRSPKLFPPQQDTVESIAFDIHGAEMLVGSDDNKVHYYAHLPYAAGPTLDEHNGRVQACAFSPKSDTIFVSGAMDKVVKVWNCRNHETVINFDDSQGGITGLAFLPTGDRFVGASLDGRLLWWRIRFDPRKDRYGGRLYRAVMAHPGGIYAMGISADGSRLITGGADNVAIVWSAETGAQVRAIKQFKRPVYAVALSPDGKIAAVGGQEGSVCVWDIAADKLLATLIPPPAPGVTAPPKSRAGSQTTSR